MNKTDLIGWATLIILCSLATAFMTYINGSEDQMNCICGHIECDSMACWFELES